MLTMKMLFLTDVCRNGKNIFEISYISPLLEQYPASNPHNSFPGGNPQELKYSSHLKGQWLYTIPCTQIDLSSGLNNLLCS